MQYQVIINMDNAAFELPEFELARILKQLGDDLESTGYVPTQKRLMDYNGNVVGMASLTK